MHRRPLDRRSKMQAFACHVLLLGAIFAVVCVGARSSLAATKTWNGGTTNWSTASNWGGTVPTSSDTVNINTTSNNPIVSNGTALANTLRVGYASGSEASLTVTGVASSLSVASSGYLGYNGIGTLNVLDGATVVFSGSLYLGYNKSASQGILNISGAGSNVTVNDGAYIGYAGSGIVTVSNGGSLAIPTFGSSVISGSITVTDSGSALTTGSLQVGFDNGSKGALSVLNGATATTIYLTLEHDDSEVIVDGAGSKLTTTDVSIGSSKTNYLTVSNGAVVSSASATIGGRYGRDMYQTDEFSVNTYYTGNGLVTVTGTGSTWNLSGDLTVGDSGQGSLLISNGGNVVNAGNGYIGVYGAYITGVDEYGPYIHSYNGAGSVTVSGAGSHWTNEGDLVIGQQGTANGTLTISNEGTVTVGGTITLAQEADTVGTLIIGSASGSAASAPGMLEAASVAFGSGTGTILFNHTSTGYIFASAVSGDGTISALSGTTYLTGDLSGFTGTTSVASAASLLLDGIYGGNLDINGLVTTTATVAGSATINEGGVLSVNSSLLGNATVNNGGTLKGNGTVGGDVVVQAGGAVAPGNSIGTLHVTGDVTFGPGSTYEVEVNDTGQSDKILATGTANLSGGAVNLLPESAGSYNLNTQYTILTASGGINGAFDSATMNTSSLFLDAALSYDDSNVYATIVRNGRSFASVASTENQTQVASALDSLSSGNLLNVAAQQTSVAQAQKVFQALSGEFHAGVRSSLIATESSFSNMLTDRPTSSSPTNAAPLAFSGFSQSSGAGCGSVWVQGYTGSSRRDGDGNTRTFKENIHEVIFGFENWLSQTAAWTSGVYVGYGRSDYDLGTDDDNAATGHATHYRFGAYAARQLGTFEGLIDAHYGYHDIDTDRQVVFTGYDARQQASYGAHTLNASGELAYVALEKPLFSIKPYIGLDAGLAATEGFTETGGDGALSAGSALLAQARTALGLRFTQKFFAREAEPVPTGAIRTQIAWMHLIGDDAPEQKYRFENSASFFSQSAKLTRDALFLKLGARTNLSDEASLDIGFASLIAPTAFSQALIGKFAISF